MTRAFRLALVLLVPGVLASRDARAQEATCQLIEKPSTQVVRYRLPSGEANLFMGGGGITMRCPSRGITLVADSIEQYGDERRIFMLGKVTYREPRLSVKSDYLTYFLNDERVVAAGNVVATLPSGSTLRGPQAEYRRTMPRVRTIAELHAIGRPTITIAPQKPRTQPGAAPRTRADEGPTTVTANTLFMRGDSLLHASGQVDIVRTDFGARGDSVFMNTQTQYMRLMREPSITGRSGRPFTLTGRLIDLFSRNRQLDRVLSQGDARAASDGLTLTSDTIEFQVAGDLLQAAFAWGPGSSEALSATQRITADSITVQMPAQRVRTMSALGAAYAEASPDTVAFRTPEKDWLRGDTIVARFDTVRTAPGDTAGARIRELVAFVGARSYQHMPPRDTALRCPAISYVRGDSLRAVFEDGKVRTVDVVKASEVSGGIVAEPDSTCQAIPVADSAQLVRPAPATVPGPAAPPRTPAPDRQPVARPSGLTDPQARPQPSRP